jgi:hypothetical protein
MWFARRPALSLDSRRRDPVCALCALVVDQTERIVAGPHRRAIGIDMKHTRFFGTHIGTHISRRAARPRRCASFQTTRWCERTTRATQRWSKPK